MGKSYFQFKRFTVHQERCAMKVGTDGVLLGSWADISEAERILDIGTGTGLIALMCSQRNPGAEVWAIDIDKASAEQAKENVQNSEFRDSIQVLNRSLQEFTSEKLFDSIICNPPFFSSGTPSPIYERYLARQSESLPLGILIENSMRLMSDSGKIHLIIPLNRESELKALCQEFGLHPIRKCVVFPSRTLEAKRLLIECSMVYQEIVEEVLIIEKEERFDYTDEFIELTREFYPKMT
ncbi:MAG: methyltransferase [Flavobacteriales bacterium]|nr:methyltransferase [Flavobacteriales bacterium]